MKVVKLFSAMIVGGILLSGGNCIAGDDTGAELITLQGGSMGTITFPHQSHQSIFVDCKPCHDLFSKEAQVIQKMKTEGKLKRKDVMEMCRNCHKDLAAKGQKTGPIACMDCHKK
jgi:hypothetical protein